jgi:SAM-dependent methyltransferase
MSSTVTRGSGLLEGFLSRKRAERANALIPSHLRQGRILDIGCGLFPSFLVGTLFNEKYAIDQFMPECRIDGITWIEKDLNTNQSLPFENGFFSVVTMLAVAEHIEPTSMTLLLQEIYRTLAPGGVVVLTTPAAWTDGLLRWMARARLVSPEEINEHCFLYTLPYLGWQFGRAGFELRKTRFGYFEFGMNLWARAEK